VRAVEAGGDRQSAHEVIRRHAVATATAMKNEGAANDLLERLAADPDFPVSLGDLQAAADPARFIGRAPQQVDEFLTEVAEPILARVNAQAMDAIRV
jgi:adenylosuccinate lyase